MRSLPVQPRPTRLVVRARCTEQFTVSFHSYIYYTRIRPACFSPLQVPRNSAFDGPALRRPKACEGSLSQPRPPTPSMLRAIAVCRVYSQCMAALPVNFGSMVAENIQVVELLSSATQPEHSWREPKVTPLKTIGPIPLNAVLRFSSHSMLGRSRVLGL